MAIFPSRYIHLGGDEAQKGYWKKCPLCQERIKKEHLANEEDLQGYFMKRMSEVTHITVAKDQLDLSNEGEIYHEEEKLIVPQGVEVYEIDGPFFFGVANKFDECMKTIGDKPRIRIIRMRKVPFMDTTGLHNLESLYRLSTKEKIQVILSGVNEQVRATLVKSSFARTIGEENICSNIHEALKRAEVCLKS